jgi:hypothetical protein
MVGIEAREVTRSLRGFALGIALGSVLAILTRKQSQPAA